LIKEQPKILLLSQWYPPAFRAGGPIKSVANLVDLLRPESPIQIACSDSDIDGSKVEFNSKEIQCVNSSIEMKSLLRNHKGLIYVNSIFSWLWGIYPLLISRKIIISPRGMLKPSALKKSTFRKKLFLKLANILGLYKEAHFIASNREEKIEIENAIRRFAGISIIENVGTKPVDQAPFIKKSIGELDLLFVGRIHPIKNLLFLLEALKSVDARINLKIIGPIEDGKYWTKCQKTISQLPNYHSVLFLDAQPFERIQQELTKAHFLVSPTLGENFGHAIFDSFAHGRPVIISDQTPWSYLEKHKCGWDLPLKQEVWTKVLNQTADLNQDDFDSFCTNSLDFAKKHSDHTRLKELYLNLFTQFQN